MCGRDGITKGEIMRDLMKCIIYIMIIGLSGFLLGRIVPKRLFKGFCFPYRPFRWENRGEFYNALGVRRWKEKFPDMSDIFPKLMPPKKLAGDEDSPRIELMIQETCVAEWIHCLLIVFGFGCVLIRKDVWGWVISVLNMLGNIPYIIIQRYNRPRLIRIFRKICAKEGRYEKDTYFELQHGAGA